MKVMRVNWLCGVHTVEYYEAVKKDRPWMPSTAGVPLSGSVLTAKPSGPPLKAAPEAK